MFLLRIKDRRKKDRISRINLSQSTTMEASDLNREPDALLGAIIAAIIALLALKLTCDAADYAAVAVLAWFHPNSTDPNSTSSDDGDDHDSHEDEYESEYNDEIQAAQTSKRAAPPVGVYLLNTDCSRTHGSICGGANCRESQRYCGANPTDDEDDEEEDREEESTENDAKWKPPPAGAWMVNTNGYLKEGVRGGAGGIIRDHNGDPILAFACAFEPNDIMVQELQAVLEGLKLAATAAAKQQKLIIVAADCVGAVRLLDSDYAFKLPKNRNVRPVVEEIRKVRETLNSAVVHVAEKSNGVAHRLSRACKKIGQRLVLRPNEFPRRISKLIEKDRNNTGLLMVFC